MKHHGYSRIDILVIVICSALALITILFWHLELVVPGVIFFILFLIFWPLDEARGSNYAGWIFICAGVIEIFVFHRILLGWGFLFLGVLSLVFP